MYALYISLKEVSQIWSEQLLMNTFTFQPGEHAAILNVLILY